MFVYTSKGQSFIPKLRSEVVGKRGTEFLLRLEYVGGVSRRGVEVGREEG